MNGLSKEEFHEAMEAFTDRFQAILERCKAHAQASAVTGEGYADFKAQNEDEVTAFAADLLDFCAGDLPKSIVFTIAITEAAKARLRGETNACFEVHELRPDGFGQPEGPPIFGGRIEV